MRPVRMVEMSVDEIVDVIAMGNGRMPAVRTMDMTRRMPAARMAGGAARRVDRGHADAVLLDRPVGILVVQVTIVQIVDMPFVFDRGMAASRTVFVIVIGVHVRHDSLPGKT